MRMMRRTRENSLHTLLRPNVIIYLDAPVDVVQRRIAEKGLAHDKGAKLWQNTEYLNDVYNTMKRNYLRENQ